MMETKNSICNCRIAYKYVNIIHLFSCYDYNNIMARFIYQIQHIFQESKDETYILLLFEKDLE